MQSEIPINVALEIKIGNFSVNLLKHSRNIVGEEAISYLFTYERFIHAEIMTHRHSRNYSSSRAIPYDKMQEWITSDPALPLHMGKNRNGMQSGELVNNSEKFKDALIEHYKSTRKWCDTLIEEYNPHKEIINRYTEPFGWITGIMTTGRRQLMNLFNLRISPMAHPNFQRLGVAMARLYRASTPQELQVGEWHLPFVNSVKGTTENVTWCVARSAWCSYNSPTKDATYERAKVRHDDCIKHLHTTPLEHALEARGDSDKRGLVPGYNSYRSMIPDECASEFDFSILDTVYHDKWYVVL